jgi:hypothetical protein
MSYYTVEDVQKILGISSSKAYQVMRLLNKELKAKGYITIAGKVPKKYFGEKYYCDTEELRRVVGR